MPLGCPLTPSQIVCTGPPAASMRFSLSPAKKAIDLLSGDQNGNSASSVPARDSAGPSEPSTRTQIIDLPETGSVYASMRPSGDTENPRSASGETLRSKRVTGAGGAGAP